MIIVIGGTSFIGVHTVNKLLEKKQKVLVTGRNNKFKKYYEELGVTFVELDLTCSSDFEKLPTKNVEGVILLAGLLPANVDINIQKDENAGEYFKVNTLGTIHVLEYCRKNSIPRVISTCSYADVKNSWKKDVPISEDEPRNYKYDGDHAVYVFSKNAANDVMEYYNKQHGMKNAVFRLPMVYGVGPHGYFRVNGLLVKSGLQIFIDNAISGKDIIIHGDKDLSRDVVYVKDVATAFHLAINNPNTYGLYNMSSGKAVTLEEQAKVIVEVFSPVTHKSVIKYDPTIKNTGKSFLFSMEKAKKDFGFVPEFADFKDMMIDYKKDLENKLFSSLFNEV